MRFSHFASDGEAKPGAEKAAPVQQEAIKRTQPPRAKREVCTQVSPRYGQHRTR